ncbi:hypothetical protein APUTEX25_005789, partial [Auxenochlorella protothecoides]
MEGEGLVERAEVERAEAERAEAERVEERVEMVEGTGVEKKVAEGRVERVEGERVEEKGVVGLGAEAGPARQPPSQGLGAEAGPARQPPSHLERECEFLEAALSIPGLKGGWLAPRPGGDAVLALQYAQRDLAANTQRRSLVHARLSEAGLEAGAPAAATPAAEMHGALACWASPSGRRRVLVRAGAGAGGSAAAGGAAPGTILEVWGPLRLERVVSVPEVVHGSVFADPWFGGAGPSWSPDERSLVYVAE